MYPCLEKASILENVILSVAKNLRRMCDPPYWRRIFMFGWDRVARSWRLCGHLLRSDIKILIVRWP